MDAFNLEYGHSNQSQRTLSSQGSKHKATMIDVVKSGYKKMRIGINNLTNMMREGVTIARRQLEIAEKRLPILEKSKP